MASARRWALGLAVLPMLAACKKKEGSHAPDRDVRSWTIAEIESELARTDQELAGEGIVVAVATPPTVPGPMVEEPAAEEAGSEPAIDDDGGTGASSPEPTAKPSEPQPMPTVAPTSAYDDEGMAHESGSLDPSSVERRQSRRRFSSRSRGDVDTRCTRICDLAEATCELETQICELAARHPDEPRYAQACARAEQQCEAASRACQTCEE